MKGSAPKFPATGSQVFVRQNARPNFAIDSREFLKSSKPIAATSRTTRKAKIPVPRRNKRPSAPLRRDGDFIMPISASGLSLDPLERFELELHDVGGKRRVAEVL